MGTAIGAGSPVPVPMDISVPDEDIERPAVDEQRIERAVIDQATSGLAVRAQGLTASRQQVGLGRLTVRIDPRVGRGDRIDWTVRIGRGVLSGTMARSGAAADAPPRHSDRGIRTGWVPRLVRHRTTTASYVSASIVSVTRSPGFMAER